MSLMLAGSHPGTAMIPGRPRVGGDYPQRSAQDSHTFNVVGKLCAEGRL